MTTDPDKLRRYYESLNDEELERQHRCGPSAFASAAVWQLVDDIYRDRFMPADEIRRARRDAAGMTDQELLLRLHARGYDDLPREAREILKEEIHRREAHARDMETASTPTARADRRTYVSLLALGFIAFLLFGPIQYAILTRDEGLGMAVAFSGIVLAIPFAVAVVCALVFSYLGLHRGSDSLNRRLLLWYGLAALFAFQLLLLDGIAGGERLPTTMLALFAIGGFTSLVATCLLPLWWLSRHEPAHPHVTE